MERTDGVPLFVEELTKALLEASTGDREAHERTLLGHTLLGRGRRSRFPARLADGAPGPARPCGQGDRPNWRGHRAGVLLRAAGRGGAAKRGRIAGLAGQARQGGADLPARCAPAVGLRVEHALVQDAAYGTLLRDRRRQLHARVAAALEEHFPDAIALQPHLAAHHCAEAGLPEKAIRHHHEAGRQAVARSAMQEAIGQLKKALALLERLAPGPGRDRLELRPADLWARRSRRRRDTRRGRPAEPSSGRANSPSRSTTRPSSSTSWAASPPTT